MDNAIGLGIILSLQDRASAGLEAVRNRMTALRDVSQEMMKKFDEGAKQMIAGFASMAAGAKVLGVLNSTFGTSVTTAADFEQAMARVGAVSGATGEDFEALSKQARDLGRDTQFSASQAAASQENLARAGFLTHEIISAMPGLLNMAAAEGMDLASAADIAASSLRGFGMDASEMNRVSDVLAKTSAASNTSIALLGESLKYVAPIAKGLGFSIEQVNAMLGVMANAGIKGSQAGTALKSAFQRLSAEPKQTAAALEKLGIKAKTSTGDMRPLPKLMEDLAEKTKNMGKAEKLGILSKVFGGVASSGMLAIMDSVANGKLPELEAALYNCSGAAKEMADRMNATAQGAMKRLESASEGLRIVIGNHLLPVYTWIIDKMAQFKSWLTQLIEEHPLISKAVIGFTAALLGLSSAALLVVGGLASISGFVKMWPLLKIMAVSALSNIKTQARMALTSFSKLGVPIVALVALAGVLFYAWRKNLWGIRDMVTAVSEGFKMALSASTDGIAEVDEELANKLKATGVWDFAVTMGKVFFRIRKLWQGFVEGIRDNVKVLQSVFSWVKNIFSPVIESGQQLLHFLGILKPAAESQVDTWQTYGLWVGRVTPSVLALYAALKIFGKLKAVTGIFGGIGKAVGGLITLITANPVAAAVVGIIVALAGLAWIIFKNWDSIKAFFAKTWQKISDYATAAINWIKAKWQAFSDWWDSWTIDDVFEVVKGWVSEKVAWVKGKWQEFSAWWDSWTFADVFAPVKEYAGSAKDYAMQKLTDLQTWWNSWTLGDVFAPVLEKGQAVWDKLTSTLESVKNTYAEKLSTVWDKMVTAYDKAQSVIVSKVISPVLEFSWNALVDGWNAASNLVSAGFEKLKAFLQIDFSGFWDTLASGFATVCDTIKGAWNGVTGFIKDTWDTAAGYVSGVWDWTKGLFGFGEDAEIVNQEQLKAQVQDITILNKMSEGFAERVAEMTRAWQPFKTSLGEGFEQIYTVMQNVADKINGTVIPAVNSLVSALSGVARELALVSQAGNLDIKVGAMSQPASGAVPAQPPRMSGGRNKSNVPAYATGGIITQPHIGLVGEAGREAIVPLEDRNSGIPLLMSAISELGVSSNDILPYLNPVAPVVSPADVSVQPLLQSSPVVNVPSVNLPEVSATPLNVSVLNDMPELGNVIVQAIRSVGNKNDVVQSQAFNSPLSVQPTPVSIQPSDVFTTPLDLSEFGNVISSLIDNQDNKDTSIKLVAPQNQAPSSPLLIQHSQNQAVMNGQAQVRAQEQSPDRPVNVNNHVDVVIEGKPVELYIGEEKVGSVVLKWVERQNIRSGMGEQ